MGAGRHCRIYHCSRLSDATRSVYKHCAADVEITGSDWRLGGFAGYAEYGKFDNCVAFGDITSTVDGWEPNVGGFIGQSDNAEVSSSHAAGDVVSASSDYKAGGFVGNYVGGTFAGCSFDSEEKQRFDRSRHRHHFVRCGRRQPRMRVLANICEGYYGGHKYSSDWTIDTAATCTTDGSKYQHCERCDAKGNITAVPGDRS